MLISHSTYLRVTRAVTNNCWVFLDIDKIDWNITLQQTSHCTVPLVQPFTRNLTTVTHYSPIFQILNKSALKKPEYQQDLKILWTTFAFFWKNDPAQTVATVRIVPKICQGQQPTFGSHCSRSHPNLFTFGGVIAECARTVFCPVVYLQYRLFKPITTTA